ncbi:acyl carrier protein [Deltaproteobacteria bacterium IMCC39524]|nr:acyl carrier protein [Deltaproteobacteria bacterium IMCC39524]
MNERLVAVLSSVFGLRQEQIVPELTKDMVSKWDSLTQMDLVVSIEQEFSITLEIEDILKMSSVAGIFEVLQGKGVDLGH